MIFALFCNSVYICNRSFLFSLRDAPQRFLFLLSWLLKFNRAVGQYQNLEQDRKLVPSNVNAYKKRSQLKENSTVLYKDSELSKRVIFEALKR